MAESGEKRASKVASLADDVQNSYQSRLFARPFELQGSFQYFGVGPYFGIENVPNAK